jgi:hypothetical protein
MRKRFEDQLGDELRFHLDALAAENIAKGMSPDEARAAALRTLGNIEKLKDDCRDTRRFNFIDNLLRDLRYAGRAMRRSPGFTALAVLIMALGIGANTAVFSVVNAALLKPLAYRDPDRIVDLSERQVSSPTDLGEQVSIANFLDWHDQSSSFEGMAFYGSREIPVMSGATAEYHRGTHVSAEFFRVFSVEPIVGRTFTDEDLKPGSEGAAMISFTYWQSHFGGDLNAPGKTIRVYGRPVRIAGVMPAGFGFPDKTDVWAPRG